MSTLTIDPGFPIHIETVNMKLGSGSRNTLVKRAVSLFRRHSQLLGLRLNLRCNKMGKAGDQYSATARLILPGYDKIVVKRGAHLATVISETLQVTDRQLRRRARAFRSKNRT